MGRVAFKAATLPDDLFAKPSGWDSPDSCPFGRVAFRAATLPDDLAARSSCSDRPDSCPSGRVAFKAATLPDERRESCPSGRVAFNAATRPNDLFRGAINSSCCDRLSRRSCRLAIGNCLFLQPLAGCVAMAVAVGLGDDESSAVEEGDADGVGAVTWSVLVSVVDVGEFDGGKAEDEAGEEDGVELGDEAIDPHDPVNPAGVVGFESLYSPPYTTFEPGSGKTTEVPSMVWQPGATSTLATNGAGYEEESRPDPPLAILTTAQFWSKSSWSIGHLFRRHGSLTHLPVTNLVKPTPTEQHTFPTRSIFRDRQFVCQAVDRASSHIALDDVPSLSFIVRQRHLT